MINQIDPDDLLVANSAQSQSYAGYQWRGGVSPQHFAVNILDECTNSNYLNGTAADEQTSSLSVDPRMLQSIYPITPTADVFDLSEISESHDSQGPEERLNNPLAASGQEMGGHGDFSADGHHDYQQEDPLAPLCRDDEHTDNNTGTDSHSSGEDEEDTVAPHDNQPLVEEDNELEEEDDPDAVPINVFGDYDINSVPDQNELGSVAKQRITQYSEAKRDGILKKRRFFIAGKLRSILGLCALRHKTDIAPDATLTYFEKVALQAACITCRNQRSLFEPREAKKQKAGKAAVAKAPAGRPPKVVIANIKKQDTPTSCRIRKTRAAKRSN